jgi:predicted metal-dependent hydrolase
MPATTTLDFTNGPLAEGLQCYRTAQFWQAHEHWESVWLISPEPEKTLLQSLIQISAAFHHLRRGNRLGTISLLGRALRRLEPFAPIHAGVHVEAIRTSVRAWLAELERDDATANLPFVPIP